LTQVRPGEHPHPVEQTAAEIIRDALCRSNVSISAGAMQVHLGTPDTNALIRDRAAGLRLAELGEEGFAVEPAQIQGSPGLIIAANRPRGVLYGGAAVADRLRLGEAPGRIALREKPVLAERNLWIWGGPKRTPDAFMHIDALRRVEQEPRFQAFGRYLAQARINAVTLWPDYDCRPDSGPHQEESVEGHQALTRFLRERYGVESYLFMWYEIKQGTPTPITGWPICPFDDRVIAHWRERIGRLIEQLPDLRGIIMAGAGGDWVRGPWECQCPRCRRYSDRELLLRAMEMIGGQWAEAGGRLIWKAVTDRPSLVPTEVEHFAELDDVLPPHVRIAHKAFYKDFRPPHPLHPLLYRHKDDPDRDRPYLCEFQIYGEYRGGTDFPCVMVDRWAQIAPMIARKRYAGMIGVCSFRNAEEWDHPLNMANWYAFGRYAWDPDTSADQIYRDWAALTFGTEVADRVVEICRLTYEASTRMMFFRGILTQNHSKLPTIDYELESSLVGPWHHLPPAPDGFIGRGHDVSCYPPEIALGIRRDPRLLLWAHQVPITAELCDEAIAGKREAWRLVQEMSETWQALPHAGWEKLHERVSRQFERNLVDAELWYEDLRLYFDYKAGRLTRKELERRLAGIQSRFDPSGGSGLVRETFGRFIEEWQRVLTGDLRRRSMEGRYHNPAGEPFLPGLSEA
jgi:alpha-glucuronidase